MSGRESKRESKELRSPIVKGIINISNTTIVELKKFWKFCSMRGVCEDHNPRRIPTRSEE